MRCVNLEYADDDEVMMLPASGAGLPTLYTCIQYIRVHIQVMMLPCSYFFHTACIGRWFAHTLYVYTIYTYTYTGDDAAVLALFPHGLHWALVCPQDDLSCLSP